MPEVQDVHVDRWLTNLSVAYSNGQYIAEDLLPPVAVRNLSDAFVIYGREKFRVPQTLRAPHTEAAEAGWSLSQDTYSCREYALKDYIDDLERQNADQPLNLEQDTVENLTDILRLDQELRVKDLIGTLDAVSAPTTKWDADGADPVDDVMAATRTFVENCGLAPNVAVVPWQVLAALKTNAAILDRIKYTQRGVVTADLLASVFEVDRVLVPSARYNTAAEGAEENMAWVWDDTVVLAYVTSRPGLRQVSLGYIFRARNWTVRRWREEARHSDAFEVSVVQDEKIVCSVAGLRIPDVLT
ncbi:MAG: major capsid protein [Armatimonadetes bacterium]|nr:major capsid protein [Armatimonadota bacterium]